MRFLVDENLSPDVAELLSQAGHDAVHVRDLGRAGASDATVMAIASDDDRVIVSADTDFGALLAAERRSEPSVLLVREVVDLRPGHLVDLIVEQLDVLRAELDAGAVAAFTRRGIRVRRLPLR